MRPLEGYAALVTGAAGGIGRAISTALAGDGAAVLLVDRDEERLGAVAKTIADAGGKADIAVADITDAEQRQATIDQAVTSFGGLDLLINNAADLTETPLADTTPETWHHTLGVNVIAPAEYVRLALPLLRTRPGAVVNISSVRAVSTVPGGVSYEVSKAALSGLTRSLAVELEATGVRVNAVCPGFTPRQVPWDEGLSAENRAAWLAVLGPNPPNTCDDIASVVSFLCGPGAGGINGEAILVDRGASSQFGFVAARRAAHPQGPT